MTQFWFFLIMATVASVSLWCGYRVAANRTFQIINGEDRHRAFKEAKQEYLQFFHEEFDPKGRDALGHYRDEVEQENNTLRDLCKALKVENAALREKLSRTEKGEKK